jgi:hypothetical protein
LSKCFLFRVPMITPGHGNPHVLSKGNWPWGVGGMAGLASSDDADDEQGDLRCRLFRAAGELRSYSTPSRSSHPESMILPPTLSTASSSFLPGRTSRSPAPSPLIRSPVATSRRSSFAYSGHGKRSVRRAITSVLGTGKRRMTALYRLWRQSNL